LTNPNLANEKNAKSKAIGLNIAAPIFTPITPGPIQKDPLQNEIKEFDVDAIPPELPQIPVNAKEKGISKKNPQLKSTQFQPSKLPNNGNENPVLSQPIFDASKKPSINIHINQQYNFPGKNPEFNFLSQDNPLFSSKSEEKQSFTIKDVPDIPNEAQKKIYIEKESSSSKKTDSFPSNPFQNQTLLPQIKTLTETKIQMLIDLEKKCQTQINPNELFVFSVFSQKVIEGSLHSKV